MMMVPYVSNSLVSFLACSQMRRKVLLNNQHHELLLKVICPGPTIELLRIKKKRERRLTSMPGK